MRVADYIFLRLQDEGISHIYSVTGRGALFLTDAVAKNSDITNISMHHEQAAGYAAVAHSQYTNSLAACLVSTGCASTNAITPVLSAWQDGIPIIFVSGQNMLGETTRFTGIPIRTFGQQEADIVSIVQGITKYAVMVTDPMKIGIEMDTLIESALSGRKGPVWLDVPLDIQSMQIEPDKLERLDVKRSEPYDPNHLAVTQFLARLDSSKRPLILIGHGVRSSGATDQLKEFQRKTRIPLIYTSSAPDVVGSSEELSIGSIGMMGCSRAAGLAVQKADLLLVLGSRMNSMITGTQFTDFARNAEVIVVDIDSIEHSKPERAISSLIQIDIKEFLDSIILEIDYVVADTWLDACNSIKESFLELEEFMIADEGIDLYQIAKHITMHAPKNAIIVTDSGLIELILPTNIAFKEGQRSIHPVSQGAMGYALPAAVGAYYSSGNPVIAVIGDGSIMMNLQELQTIRHNKLPIKVIVINNNAYSIIRKRQIELFRGRTIGTDSSNGLSCPNFEDVASCFGFSYLKASGINDLEATFTQAIQIEGPVLFEVMGVTDQDYIQVSRKKNSDGKLVKMPIEDQAPFLDSEFLKRLSELVDMEKR